MGSGRWPLSLLAALLLCSCGATKAPDPKPTNLLEASSTPEEIDALAAANAADAYLRGDVPEGANQASASAPVEPAAAAPEPRPRPEPVAMCWQDYCPCEPPQGGPDQGICRQLRAGMHVEDQMMAAAAMMRDARKQMADFEAEHGPLGR